MVVVAVLVADAVDLSGVVILLQRIGDGGVMSNLLLFWWWEYSLRNGVCARAKIAAANHRQAKF